MAVLITLATRNRLWCYDVNSYSCRRRLCSHHAWFRSNKNAYIRTWSTGTPTHQPSHMRYHNGMNSTKILTSCYMFPHTRQSRLSHVTVSSGREEMPSKNMPVERLKVTILPLDLLCSGLVMHAWEILTTASLTRTSRTGYSRKTTRNNRIGIKFKERIGQENRHKPLIMSVTPWCTCCI